VINTYRLHRDTLL